MDAKKQNEIIKKIQAERKVPLKGKSPLGRMKLGGSLLVKNPSKLTHECKTCGFKSTEQGFKTLLP